MARSERARGTPTFKYAAKILKTSWISGYHFNVWKASQNHPIQSRESQHLFQWALGLEGGRLDYLTYGGSPRFGPGKSACFYFNCRKLQSTCRGNLDQNYTVRHSKIAGKEFAAKVYLLLVAPHANLTLPFCESDNTIRYFFSDYR